MKERFQTILAPERSGSNCGRSRPVDFANCLAATFAVLREVPLEKKLRIATCLSPCGALEVVADAGSTAVILLIADVLDRHAAGRQGHNDESAAGARDSSLPPDSALAGSRKRNARADRISAHRQEHYGMRLRKM